MINREATCLEILQVIVDHITVDEEGFTVTVLSDDDGDVIVANSELAFAIDQAQKLLAQDPEFENDLFANSDMGIELEGV